MLPQRGAPLKALLEQHGLAEEASSKGMLVTEKLRRLLLAVPQLLNTYVIPPTQPALLSEFGLVSPRASTIPADAEADCIAPHAQHAGEVLQCRVRWADIIAEGEAARAAARTSGHINIPPDDDVPPDGNIAWPDYEAAVAAVEDCDVPHDAEESEEHITLLATAAAATCEPEVDEADLDAEATATVEQEEAMNEPHAHEHVARKHARKEQLKAETRAANRERLGARPFLLALKDTLRHHFYRVAVYMSTLSGNREERIQKGWHYWLHGAMHLSRNPAIHTN